MRARRGSAAVVVGLGLVMISASCSSGISATANSSSGTAKSGGTLYVLGQGPVATWDPQRLNVGADMAFAGRVFQRTLTAWAPATSQDTLPALSPDLATDTGQMSNGGRTWTFTLRGDATWQDGRPVTCADVKYGVSRTFATTQIAGGLNYAMDLLDVVSNLDGSSSYGGPYTKTGQGGFDKAVTCAGQSITFNLAKAVPDFNQVVALPAFAPVRSDKDRGAASVSDIFSDGPYMLKAAWQPGKGATFVRNPAWRAASDPIRKAYPSTLVYQDGVPVATAQARIMTSAGTDSFAVTADSVPQGLQKDILSNPGISTRSSNPLGPFVDYLLPNFSRPTMANASVRQALAMATNRAAYVTALGGAAAAEATYAMISRPLPAYQEFNPLNVPLSGDVTKARALLKASGLGLPVKITVAYRNGAPADRAMAALKQSWQEAGFSVTLVGIATNYFTNIASVANSRNYDVMWAVGSAQWPSGSSVIPSLFDAAVNLSPTSSGQDYGRFSDPATSAKMDAAELIPGAPSREKAWADLDQLLEANVSDIPLADSKAVFLHGAGVTSYIDNQALFGTVDLATVSVR